MSENDFYIVNLRHFYDQFNGEFFFWIYMSWDKLYAPKKFRFVYGNKIIDAETEAMYFNSAFVEKEGRNALFGTRNAELLLQAYSAPDLKIPSSYWMDHLMDHIIKCYYPDSDLPQITPPNTPICSQIENADSEKTLAKNGCLKLLLLRRIRRDENKEETNIL